MVPGLLLQQKGRKKKKKKGLWQGAHLPTATSFHQPFINTFFIWRNKINGKWSSFSAFNFPGMIQVVTQLRSNTFIFPPEPAWLQTSCFSIRDCNISGKDYVCFLQLRFASLLLFLLKEQSLSSYQIIHLLPRSVRNKKAWLKLCMRHKSVENFKQIRRLRFQNTELVLQFINPVTHGNKHFSVGFQKEKGYNCILNKNQGSFRRSPGLLLSHFCTLDIYTPHQDNNNSTTTTPLHSKFYHV